MLLRPVCARLPRVPDDARAAPCAPAYCTNRVASLQFPRAGFRWHLAVWSPTRSSTAALGGLPGPSRVVTMQAWSPTSARLLSKIRKSVESYLEKLRVRIAQYGFRTAFDSDTDQGHCLESKSQPSVTNSSPGQTGFLNWACSAFSLCTIARARPANHGACNMPKRAKPVQNGPFFETEPLSKCGVDVKWIVVTR